MNLAVCDAGKPELSGVQFVCAQSFEILQTDSRYSGAALTAIKDVANDSISTCARQAISCTILFHFARLGRLRRQAEGR